MRKRPLERLSGGQSQRVKFALAMAGRPRLLVLDEPTAAMDVQSRQDFWRSIRAYADGGHTVLFSTHFLEEADRNADRIVVISAGRVVADGIARRAARHDRSAHRFGCPTAGTSPGGASRGHRRGYDRGDRVALTTADADATVTALARAAAGVDLEISGADLEEVFLAITARPVPSRPDDGGAERSGTSRDPVRSTR